METEVERARRVAWALNMTRDTRLAPDGYERQLLEQYVRGVLTLDEVVTQLDCRSADQAIGGAL